MKYGYYEINGDFKCGNCNRFVSADTMVSGTVNRNHCPYCLHSKHLDLRRAGDRLSACKGKMRPIGLTLKKANKKYAQKDQGELMLVHQCLECGKLSINRIAADDIDDYIYDVFRSSLQLTSAFRRTCLQNDIQLLQAEDEPVVQARLFGWQTTPSRQIEFA